VPNSKFSSQSKRHQYAAAAAAAAGNAQKAYFSEQ
jgi:hypothetical protein